MLLKTIRTPNQSMIGNPLVTEQLTPEGVDALYKHQFGIEGILPVISHESVKQLGRVYDLYRVCPETKQIGDFAGDMNLPHNCVAVIYHKNYNTDPEFEIEYITSDVEAYIISDAGVTVTVINGKKAVDEKNLRVGKCRHPTDASHITIHGGNVKIDTPHLNIHQGVGDSKTGPAL